MHWLLDQGLPRSAAAILRDSQEDTIHVGDIGMAEALDSDIHAILALAGSSKPSVIRIREEGLKGQQMATLILQIGRQFRAELLSGCVMTFIGGKIRHRALPL